MQAQKISPIEVRRLLLDPENPRLPESLLGKPQEELLAYFHEEGVLDELAQSFLDNSYFIGEPLIVTPEGKDFVVLEGNRRLSTLMILHGLPPATGHSFGDIQASPTQLDRLLSVPCLIVADRASVAPLIGFRHIGGLKKWEPQAKARFVLQHVDAAAKTGAKNPFFDVARSVGSNTQSIRGSYAGLAILRHARNEYGLDVGRVLGEQRFGVWLRALNSPDLRQYIGYGDPTTYPEVREALKGLRKDRLQEVLGDFIPRPEKQRAVLHDSRFATEYGRVLNNNEARRTLRKTGDLDLAMQVIDQLDLPARIRKLTDRAEVLVTAVSDTEMTEELSNAISQFFRVGKTMYGLAKAAE